MVMATIFGVLILFFIVYGFVVNVACEMYLMSIFLNFLKVGCLAGIVLTNLHLYYDFLLEKPTPKEPTKNANLSNSIED